ncbi:hypothetical protein D3C77_582630 [compost metagenome]
MGETCGRFDDQVRERPTGAHAPEKPVVHAWLLRLLAPESAGDQLAVVLVPLRVGYASREKGASLCQNAKALLKQVRRRV